MKKQWSLSLLFDGENVLKTLLYTDTSISEVMTHLRIVDLEIPQA